MIKRVTLLVASVVDVIHLLFLLSNSVFTYYVYLYATTGSGQYMMNICLQVMVLVAILQAVFGRCPLTVLSEWLRRRYDPGFEMKQGFIQHYAKTVWGIELTAQQVSMIIIGANAAPTVIFCCMYLIHISTR